MKRKNILVISIAFSILFLMMYFIPIPTEKMCGESPVCWCRFGVYNYEYNDETGGNTYFGGNLSLSTKIGGVLEYFF